MRARRIAAHAVACLALLAGPDARADEPEDVTAEERALLPNWCNFVQGWHGAQGEAQYKKLLGTYGPGFSHMHHYCWAQIYIMRLNRFKLGQRSTFQRVRALDDIDYVLRATKDNPRFVFRPEILATKARLLMGKPDLVHAARTAEQLMREWPELPGGYVLLADALLRAGERDKALAVLAKGEESVKDKEQFAKQRSTLNLN